MSTKSPDSMDRERTIRLAIGAAIVLLVVLFAIFNAERVEVDWILFERDSRLIYVIIGSALLGAVADRLFQKRRKKP